MAGARPPVPWHQGAEAPTPRSPGHSGLAPKEIGKFNTFGEGFFAVLPLKFWYFGAMNEGIQQVHLDLPFTTEDGFTFSGLSLAFKTWGKLNALGSNVVLVCHALTGHAAADEWFPGIFTERGFASHPDAFVVCVNVIGSCYGSTGPQSVNPATGRPFLGDFPNVTIRDMVRSQQLLLDRLGVREIQVVIGASMGGMLALEWAVMDERVKRVILLATNAAHSAWQIGISEAQRQAIYADPHWRGGFPLPEQPPTIGLSAARMMAMITYRSEPSFRSRFGRTVQPNQKDLYQVESYLRYQGQKLVDRMDAVTYVRLTQAMDSHDVCRGRGDLSSVLGAGKAKALVVGISSDILYPVSDQKLLADGLTNADFVELNSDKGHDAFLIEFDKMNQVFRRFLSKTHYPNLK